MDSLDSVATNSFQSMREEMLKLRANLQLPSFTLEPRDFSQFLYSTRDFINMIVNDNDSEAISMEDQLDILLIIEGCFTMIKPYQTVTLCNEEDFEKNTALEIINSSIAEIDYVYTISTDFDSFINDLAESSNFISSKIHSLFFNIANHLSEIMFLIERSAGITNDYDLDIDIFVKNFFVTLEENDDYFLIHSEKYPTVVVDSFSENFRENLASLVANTAGEGNVSIFDSFGLFSPAVNPAYNKDEKILSERLQQAEILLANQETVTHHTNESLISSLRLFVTVIFCFNKYGNIEYLQNNDVLHTRMIKYFDNLESFINQISLLMILNSDEGALLQEVLYDLHFFVSLVVAKIPNFLFIHDFLQEFLLVTSQLINLYRKQNCSNEMNFLEISLEVRRERVTQQKPRANEFTDKCLSDWQEKFANAKSMKDIIASSPSEDCYICYKRLEDIMTADTGDLTVLARCRHIACLECLQQYIIKEQCQ